MSHEFEKEAYYHYLRLYKARVRESREEYFANPAKLWNTFNILPLEGVKCIQLLISVVEGVNNEGKQ